MVAKNLLIIMSDEHNAEIVGCAGHAQVKTPHLDELAARGTRFTNAYTPSPICVPARAAFHTGRHVHETGYWDSAQPYDGRIPTWGHRLHENDCRSVSIGKLHFRSTEDDNGFDPELLPMHVVNGVGWVQGLIRNPLPDYRDNATELADDVGRGESSYTAYDRAITERTCQWLREDANADERPWALFVSLVSPHFPLTAPNEFYDMYPQDGVDLPRHTNGHFDHPVLNAMREFWCYDDFFDEAKMREGRAAYLGLVSFLDHNVGRILAALGDAGLEDETRIIYTSDHGELLGNHGFWTKQLIYEESVGVPLIMAGPGVPQGEIRDTPVTLLDLYPTALDCMDIDATDDDPRHARSLLESISNPAPDRTIISEYHDGGSPTGFFMVRWANWKFIHYVGARPQLFDLDADPYEETDLGESDAHTAICDEGEKRLRTILDPEEVNARAFADQNRKIADYGGPEGIAGLFRFNHTPTPV
ncbi:MAG: sulfatase-like hydrolase/transferase [Hyphomicrobiaceae bacterium]